MIRPIGDTTVGHPADEQHPRELARAVEALGPLLGTLEHPAEPLAGGITNRNFRVRLGGADYVLRLPGKDTDLLGIDRRAERAANARAAELGIAPAVAAQLDDPPCLVTRFVQGRDMSPQELRASAGEVAAALRSFHDSGLRLAVAFDSFRVPLAYAATARARGAEPPPGFEVALAHARRIEAALSGPEHSPVPCHNDLLAANFIHDGRLLIIDWEYAGMGDRYFDLGNFAANNELGEADEQRLLAAYFGEQPGPRRLATLRLFRFNSDFREAMWGVVQATVSELDFDFDGYAARHFARMAATAADSSFERWLAEAADD